MVKTGITLSDLTALQIPDHEAQRVLDSLSSLPDSDSAPERWRAITAAVLTTRIPYSVHRLLFDATYNSWDSPPPPPAWLPTPEIIEQSNIAAFCRRVGLGDVQQLHQWTASNRTSFWKEAIKMIGIRFSRDPDSMLDAGSSIETARWLPGAKMNVAENCFPGNGESPAIVYQPNGGSPQTISYDQLDRLSNRVANSLVALGLRKAEPIAISMPMTVEAVAAYLGIIKAGCVVVSIADSFSPEEMATRLRIAGATMVITQDLVMRGHKQLPMYERVRDSGAERIVVIPSLNDLRVPIRNADIEWSSFLSQNDVFSPIQGSPDEHSNILFSSGTTGDPKAIPWTHLTPIKCAVDGLLHHDIHRDDIVAWPTNLGWMMGPWLIFATLLNRGTIALYYGAPGTREFCEFVQNANVNMLGVVPSLVKAWRNNDMINGLDWNTIKAFSSTGESSNKDDMLYLMSRAGYKPIIEYCGGTEIGGGYISGTVIHPASPATFTTPAFGLDFLILDENGNPAENGELYLMPPSIGLSTELLNKNHHDVYFADAPSGPNGEVLRRHGDQMESLAGGYFSAHGRADDTMNLSGIKVSSAEIERVAARVDGVSETAAIAVPSPGGGPSLLVIFAVPEPGSVASEGQLRKLMQRQIAKDLNPLFKIHAVELTDSLPRTASNKVMRRVLRQRYTESTS